MRSPTDFDDFDDFDDSDTTYIPFGGRLQYYSDEWLNNFGYQNATKFVQRGYYPKWDSYPPPLSIPPISRQQDISNFYTMRQVISHLLEDGIIRRFSTRKRCFLSESSIKLKTDGNHRLVLDLRNLNNYVKQLPFTMEGINLVEELIQQRDYMVSIDLVDAFYHIPLHPDAQKYFVFDFDYERYCFQCLPFSLKTSSWVFKTVLQPIIEMLRDEMEIRIVAYCDDMLIMSHTWHRAKRHRDIVIDLLERHGFMINEDKSQLTPRRSIEYLGRVINSTHMTFSAPEHKIEKLLDECIYIYNQRYIEIRTLTSLISKLHNIVRDSEYTKELRRDKNSHQGRNPYSKIQLSREGRQELKYWIDNMEELNGYPINST